MTSREYLLENDPEGLLAASLGGIALEHTSIADADAAANRLRTLQSELGQEETALVAALRQYLDYEDDWVPSRVWIEEVKQYLPRLRSLHGQAERAFGDAASRRLQTDLTESESANEELTEEAKQLRANNAELERQLEQCRSENANLRAQAEQQKDIVPNATVVAENARLQDEVTRLQGLVEDDATIRKRGDRIRRIGKQRDDGLALAKALNADLGQLCDLFESLEINPWLLDGSCITSDALKELVQRR